MTTEKPLLPKLLPGALVGDKFVDGKRRPPLGSDWIDFLRERGGVQLVLPGLEP